MTHDSGAPTPRFRSARVLVPETAEERIEALLDDGPRMYEAFEAAAIEAARARDWERVVRLAGIGARSSDPQRTYAVCRLSASLLIAAAAAEVRDDSVSWAAPLDRAAELLIPALEANPHEPELLDLLGVVAFELGDVPAARRLFEAIRAIEPEHAQARQHLRACRARPTLVGSDAATRVPEQHAPTYMRARTHIKRIAEAAQRLPNRTISLCMIVKDEEEMLPGCLEAAARYVDQIVVVDTGSTDRTREIAAEHGATVVDFSWTGSFSDARNESLRHATGDWVLYLDADEHLVGDDGAQLHQLARRTWIEGWQIVETHFVGAAELGTEATHTPLRMFQRRPGYGWRGNIHEQILWALPTWLTDRIRPSTVRVNHYGYLASVVEERDKRTRNLDLLMAQVAGERTPFTCFNIGTEHAAAQNWDVAIGWFEEALALARAGEGWRQEQFAPLMVQRTVGARRATGNLSGAIELAREALEWWPDYTDLVYEQALANLRSNDGVEAERLARLALELGDAPARFVAVAGKGSFQARILLASILRRRGDRTGAREQLELAVVEAPQYLTSAVELTELLLDEPGAEASLVSSQLDELLGERATTVIPNMVIGAVFHEAGQYRVADERYDRVLAAIPTHGGGLLARAELRLAQGELREAWESALAIEPLDPMAARGGLTAFLAAAALGDGELLDAPAARIAAGEEELHVAERAVYVAWRALLQPHGPAGAIPTLLPIHEASSGAVLRNLEALAKLEATDGFECLFPLLAQVVPDERTRRLQLADLYLRRRFADMAGEELFACAERFGADATVLTGLGKVATIKELWEDAEIFLTESLQLDPTQSDARRLLDAVRTKAAG